MRRDRTRHRMRHDQTRHRMRRDQTRHRMRHDEPRHYMRHVQTPRHRTAPACGGGGGGSSLAQSIGGLAHLKGLLSEIGDVRQSVEDDLSHCQVRRGLSLYVYGMIVPTSRSHSYSQLCMCVCLCM